MHKRRWWLALGAGLGVALTGCGGNGGGGVSQQQFDSLKQDFVAFQASVHASGESLDTWVGYVHTYIHWLHDNMGAICPSCTDPPPPPNPPPDGQW